jgi:nucleoid-associated protein YgaU
MESCMLKQMQNRLNSVDAYVSMVLGLAVVLVAGSFFYNLLIRKPIDSQLANQTQNQEIKSSVPAVHVVESGDTLWTIAERYYNSGYNWVDIAKANNLANPDILYTGTKLNIPEAKSLASTTGQILATSTDIKKYTVKSGDSLWTIAVNQYQDGYKWTEIAKANNLVNPRLIHSGNELIIP